MTKDNPTRPTWEEVRAYLLNDRNTLNLSSIEREIRVPQNTLINAVVRRSNYKYDQQVIEWFIAFRARIESVGKLDE